MNDINFVRETYRNKTKFKEITQLKRIIKYLNRSELTTVKISFGDKISVDLFDIDLELFKNIQVRPETVFKANILVIKYFLQKLFNDCKILVDFEEPSTIERNIHRIQNYYKHDAIIKIYSNTKFFEVGLEYNEEKSHCNTRQINNDNSRNINSKMFLDLFCAYEEEKDNYLEFMQNLIYNLIKIGCCINKDEYFLAKILCLKEENLNLLDEQFFDLVLDWKKKNIINLEEFVELIIPHNEDNNEYTLDSYLEHLEDLQVKVNDKKCDYANFIKLINNESRNCSNRIITLRKIQSYVADKLNCATKEIMTLIEEMNEKKELIVPYTEEIVKNLHILHNKKIVEIGIENFNKMQN